MWVWSLGWEDPMEEDTANCSSILSWRIPWTEESSGLSSMGSQRVRHICVTKHTHTLAIKWWDLLPWSSFFECWVLGQLFHSPLSLSSRGSLVPFHFLSLEWYHLHIWGCWYFSWQSWFQLVIHLAQHSPVYKLNKQGDTIQPCCTSLPILTLNGSSLIRSNGFT